MLKTDTEQRIQLQRPLLSPVDRRGERANKYNYQTNNNTFLGYGFENELYL